MTVIQELARHCLTAHPLGGAATYQGAAGDVTTVVALLRTTESFGAVPISESRWYLAFLSQDVANPRRGDRFTLANAEVVILQERRVDASQHVDRWDVTKRS